MRERLLPCGTRAAYRRHLRRGQMPCRECRAANAVASKAGRWQQEALDADFAELIGLLYDLINDDYERRQRARYRKDHAA